MAVLELHSAKKSFGKKEVLSSISFSLKTGDVLGLFGSNGCGKSSLLKIIYGTLPASEIFFSIDHEAIQPSEVIKNKLISYVPQDPFLPTQLKVRELIPIYFSEEEKQDLLFYDPIIAGLTSKKVHALSSGQRKYIEVMLIAHLEHPFLFLDEPFTMLEPLQIERLSFLLRSLQHRKGILITDHYYDTVLDLSTKQLLIKNGKSFTIKDKTDLLRHDYISSL